MQGIGICLRNFIRIKEFFLGYKQVTRCAEPRRTGEDFDSLPFALLDLPYPSPDDQGLTALDPGLCEGI